MTTEPDLTAMSLALASAKRPCTGCQTILCPVKPYGWDERELCEGTGEVSVLGPEVRVECVAEWDIQRDHPENGHCYGRRWNPLDPEKLGRWGVALRRARYLITSHVHLYPPEWEFKMGLPPNWFEARADTPELAFFQAAMKALSLPTEPSP